MLTGVDIAWAFPSTTVIQLGRGAQNLKYSPDGRLLAVARDSSVLLLDAKTLAQVGVLLEQDDVGPMDFSPDGRLLALGLGDNTFSLWDVQRTEQRMRWGKPLRSELGGAKAAAFSFDGRFLATLDYGALEVRDVNTMHPVLSQRTYRDGRRAVALLSTPDNRFIAIDQLEETPDDSVILWEVQTGKDLLQIEDSYLLAISPDGKTLATVGGFPYGAIKLWDLQTGTALRTLKIDEEPFDISSLTFCSDGTVLATATSEARSGAELTASGVVRLWDVQTGRLLKTLKGHTEWVAAVAFSPDGKTVASGGRELKFWDLPSGREKVTLSGHPDVIFGAAFSPGGRLISGSGGLETTIIHWDLQTGKPLKIFQSERALQSEPVVGDLSPDGHMFAVGVASRALKPRTIKVWDAQTGTLLQSLEGARSIGSLAFSPDSKLLASGSDDETIRVWDVQTWKVDHILTGQPGVGGLRALAFSPDGKMLASGKRNGSIQLWDLQTERPLVTLPEESLQALTFSPDGVLLASSGVNSALSARNLPGHTIKIWEIATGKLLRTFRDEYGFITSLAFHPNGKILASGTSGSSPDRVKLWDVHTGEALRTLPADVDINTLVFSPDGQYLAVASGLYVWNLTKVLSPDFSTDPLVEKPLLPEVPPPTVLLQNYPNPFQPHEAICRSGTHIPFVLGGDAEVMLTIYNLMGQQVRQFDFGHLPAGDYRFPPRSVRWDGRNDAGEPVTSGVYFYSLQAGTFRATRKMVLKK